MDLLPANTKNSQIDPFVDGQSAISPIFGGGIILVSSLQRQVYESLAVKFCVSKGQESELETPKNYLGHGQGRPSHSLPNVLLCFIIPILGNRYGPGVNSLRQ